MSTFGNMYSGTGVKPGQREYVPSGGGSLSWKVPEGVTSICAVVVGAPWARNTSPTHSTIRRGTATLLSSGTPLGGGVGGGNGGLGGYGGHASVYVEDSTPGQWYHYNHTYMSGGGGGAGGYTGDGGGGGHSYGSSGVDGGAGSGGGGGGGRGGYGAALADGSWIASGGDGGGVGLRGIGSNGAGGNSTVSADGGAGSRLLSGQPTPGGAPSGSGFFDTSLSSSADSNLIATTHGHNGGNLRWKNDIPVTPGETLTLYAGAGGGLRVLWGGGRSYPSNAGDL